MHIRPLRAPDIPPLARFAAESFARHFGHLYDAADLHAHLSATCSEDFFAQALAHDALLGAFDGDRLAAYAKAGAVGVPAPHPLPGSAELHRFYVDAAYHGTGLAQRLMESVLALPVLSHASEIYVGVWENNIRAQRFYARYGFGEIGEYQYQVGRVFDRELILRRANPISLPAAGT